MGSALGIPLSTFLQELFQDPVRLLKTFITYWFLKVCYRDRRLDVYDPYNPKELTNIGALIPENEQKYEPPENQLSQHTTDSVLVYGSNSSGDTLVVRICREQEGHVPWLVLDLSDGTSYTLPSGNKCYPAGPEFVAGGLRIKCHIPMRRWRISYNGLLRQLSSNGSENRVVHVKFSFLCISTSFPFDAYEDIHPVIMTDFLRQQDSLSWIPKPRKVTKYLNRYVQAASVIGTVTVDGSDDVELNLWGVKHRARDYQTCRDSSASKLLEVLAYTKDGQMIYTGELKPPGFKTKLQYGHYMARCGLAWPAISCKQHLVDQSSFNGIKVDLQTRSFVSADISAPTKAISCPSGVRKGHVSDVYLSSVRTDDGDLGYALVMNHVWEQGSKENLPQAAWKLPAIDARSSGDKNHFLLPLYDPLCQDTSLTGGKGSSLAALTYLSSNYKTNFDVPGGFVVTTDAYQVFFNQSGIKAMFQKFERDIASKEGEKREEACQNLVNQVSGAVLPRIIEEAIRKQLLEQFLDPQQVKRFAVRSSAAGEDSEEMSAAGQMSTLLGVQGVNNILRAVVKCWASQFSFTAIQYKRQNGQELNSLMAVVVQEMVPADMAGVLFTCDPVTGNPENITITGNFGIGESVVGASAEPDTVVLQRDENNRFSIKNVMIGKKRTIIVMAEQGDVEEKSSDENSNVCCISPENSHILTEASLKIEEAYGFPVDVEWAFRNNKLFMLQARPVTTFDKETSYELAHSIDNGFRAEKEYNTKANIGEVMTNAISHLGQTYFGTIVSFMFFDLYKHRNPYCFPFNPFQKAIVTSQNHSFMSLPNMILRFYKKTQKSFLSECNVISGFGRLLEDEDVYDQADKRNRTFPGTFFPYQLIFFIGDLLFSERRLKRSIRRFWSEEMDLKHCKNSREMFLEIQRRCFETVHALQRHMENTTNSSIYSGLLMSILASANKGWGNTVFGDFAMILSSCGDMESADIPFALELLLKEIRQCIDVEKFRAMEPKDALEWLESSSSGSACILFKDFIQKHGHRCVNEFDVYSKTWRMDKLPVMQVLKDAISQSKPTEKKNVPAKEVISQLKVPLTWKAKVALRWLIPMCRKAVCNRETGKSLLIKHFDFARKGFWKLAELMEKEGRIPDKELLFFLSDFETLQLIDTRSPLLLQKATRRRQIFPELNKLRFPEISAGVPKASNATKREDFSGLASDLEIKGVPVSQGVIKGPARVAVNLKEAADIKKGEILIAYSTDIAWSAYFPLLAGVATELGGLISHGAVVAREYGLPCVVGVFDATVLFKTGDMVLLDGTKGLLRRIPETST